MPGLQRSTAVLMVGMSACVGSPLRAADAAPELRTYAVVADSIPAALTSERGDAARGRAIVVSRQAGMCLLCHSGPFPEEQLQGTLGPDLTGSGARWTEGQLRLRIVDSRRINPATIMPSYYRVDHLAHVGPSWRGRPVLDAQQVEDVVALLQTLR